MPKICLVAVLLLVAACKADQRVENPYKKQTADEQEMMVREAPPSTVRTRDGQPFELFDAASRG